MGEKEKRLSEILLKSIRQSAVMKGSRRVMQDFLFTLHPIFVIKKMYKSGIDILKKM